MDAIVCKGSWDIGNNCGRCTRCFASAETGVAKIKELQSELAMFRRRRTTAQYGNSTTSLRPDTHLVNDIRDVFAEANDLFYQASRNGVIVTAELDLNAAPGPAPQAQIRLLSLAKEL